MSLEPVQSNVCEIIAKPNNQEGPTGWLDELKLGLSEIEYCVLHGGPSIVGAFESDLDLAVAPKELNALRGVLENLGEIAQCYEYESTARFFVVATDRGGHLSNRIKIDAITDYRHRGAVILRGPEMLRRRRLCQGWWVAAPDVELSYLLVKHAYKGALPAEKRVRLVELSEILTLRERTMVARLFGSKHGQRLLDWILRGDWLAIESNLPSLWIAARRAALRRDLLNPIRYWLPEMRRIARRWRRPTGLFVVMLGPDGAGKSTLISNLRDTTDLFRRAESFHWQPYAFFKPRFEEAVSEPHGRRPRGLPLSLLKLCYYWFDYLCGYIFKVRPHLVRSTLVLFDRYYQDLLVDQLRYRYSGPRWLIRLGSFLVPKPDLFFVLDVPTHMLLARKAELPADELTRQRDHYMRLAADLPRSYVLDGSKEAMEVAAEARGLIAALLAERDRRRRFQTLSRNGRAALWGWASTVFFKSGWAKLAEGRTADRSAKTGDSFLPIVLRDGRGYLIPSGSSKAAARGLDVWRTHRLAGRVSKAALKTAMRLGVGVQLLPRVHILRAKSAASLQVSVFDHIRAVLGSPDLAFSISLGSPGPYRKPVIQVMSGGGEIIGFAKVGSDSATGDMVASEAAMYRRLAETTAPFCVPRVIYTGRWNDHFLLIQSPPAAKATPAPTQFTQAYSETLIQFSQLNGLMTSLRESEMWANLQHRSESMKGSYYRALMRRGIEAVSRALRSDRMLFHICHGDFAPWNAALAEDRLFLFDWEYSQWMAPPAWDLFHFFVTTLWTLRRRSSLRVWEALLDESWKTPGVKRYLEVVGLDRDDIRPLCLLYVLGQIAWYATDFATIGFLASFANLLISTENAREV